MKLDCLIRDPVFQLNLLLWMAKEQPTKNGFVVNPLFFTCGFSIIYIENPFPLPEETLAAIEKCKLEISKEPEPELLLGRMSDKRALYLEAKANSFSPESDNCKQARGHLLATGDVFGEVMTPYQESLLCYVVPADKCCLMRECLSELVVQLTAEGTKPGQHSSHGLHVDGSDLWYSWDGIFTEFAGLEESQCVVLSSLETDTDPTPLFLIYSDEDYPSDEHRNLLRRVLVSQVHAELVCRLNRLPLLQEYRVTADKLLVDMTDGLFKYLGKARQRGMRRLLVENIFKRLADFWKERQPGLVSFTNRSLLEISFPSASAKREFLDWFEDFNRTAFSKEKPPEEEPTLFGNFFAEFDEGADPSNSDES